MNKPELKIIGTHGNAYALIGKARRKLKEHLREEGKTREEIDESVKTMVTELKSGNYDHLLGTLHKYFDVC